MRGVAFQPFLDNSRRRPVGGRAHAVSVVLHGVAALLIWLALRPVETAAPSAPARRYVALSWRARPVAPAAPPPVAPPVSQSASPAVRSLRTRPVTVAAMTPAPEPPAATEVVPETGGERGPEPGDDLGGPGGPAPAESGAPGAGAVGGQGAGRRPPQLFGRVVGGGRHQSIGTHALPYAPLKESTELRTYDVFPPLPASQWTGERPYVIVLDVCVSGEGEVSDVDLIKPASRTLDPVVLAAVRTWRYRPRLVEGQAHAFCHVVAIKYEQL